MHGNVLEKNTSSHEESEIFCQTGTITFKNLTETELSQYRVKQISGFEGAPVLPTRLVSTEGVSGHKDQK